MKTESYITYDALKNRIYLYMEGLHDLEEALRLRDEYEKAIGQCRPGFTVLANVSKYRPGAPEIQKVHAEAAKMAADAGVQKVARVVGETPLGGMQIDRIAKTEGHYPSAHFTTTEEAKTYLDSDEE